MPSKFISNGALRDLLTRAAIDERLTLTKLLDETATQALPAEDLQVQICRAGGHAVANWLRGQGTGYIDVLADVVEGLKVPSMPSYLGAGKFHGHSLWKLDELSIIKTAKRDVEECRRVGLKHTELAEGKVLLKLLEVTYERLSPEQRRIFDERVREVANSFGGSPAKGLACTAGLLAIGNLGGFATYTLMSTVLSGISLGTLGFGAYTLASSALSVALGPVGWIGLGVAGVYSFGGPALKKTIPLVANVAMIRQRLKSIGVHAQRLPRR